jgi:hypothetical protein
MLRLKARSRSRTAAETASVAAQSGLIATRFNQLFEHRSQPPD